MYHDLREVFWWEGLKKVTAEFVAKCPNFAISESQTQKARWLTSRNQTPTRKSEDINMDFVVGLPLTQKQDDSRWVIVDMLTKSAHFIPIKSTYSVEDYEKFFINEIVCRHGIPLCIISESVAQFTSMFWR